MRFVLLPFFDLFSLLKSSDSLDKLGVITKNAFLFFFFYYLFIYLFSFSSFLFFLMDFVVIQLRTNVENSRRVARGVRPLCKAVHGAMVFV